MSKWNAIKTAPDGEWILIARFAPNTQWHGRMEVSRKNTDNRFGTFNEWYPPTHWMPLPEPLATD